jgi:hypothetical protein
MRQETTGIEETVYEGWSWPCFFFGSLWYLAKGMWGIGLAWAFASVLSGSFLHWIGIMYMPTVANRHYLDHLGSRGYQRTFTNQIQVSERASAKARRYQLKEALVTVLIITVGILFFESEY